MFSLDRILGLILLKIFRFTNHEETNFLIAEKYYNGAIISMTLDFGYFCL